MKIARIFSLFLVLLMLISTLAACGNTPDETSKDATESSTVEEDPRQQLKDTVPTDLKYNGETVTFLSVPSRI